MDREFARYALKSLSWPELAYLAFGLLFSAGFLLICAYALISNLLA